jgi:NhaA family Na+:H+ antiporter
MAMVLANSPFSWLYQYLTELRVTVSVDSFIIDKPLLHWINDGLMGFFFFMVGLEIKREAVEGSLKQKNRIVLPIFAAFGGMLIPALIYAAFNWNAGRALEGWGVPVATDIAFALGILSLLGKRVPHELKIFLLALAIFDDIGAIMIIAVYYSHDLIPTAFGIATVMVALLILINRFWIINNSVYIFLGLLLWVALLKSGVHATLGGVIIGLSIPIKNNEQSFADLQSSLHAPVNFIILPLFAFVNSGIVFETLNVYDLTDNVTLGIALGLLLGKQVGIFIFSWMAVKSGLGRLPNGVNWAQIYGVGVLSGVGFTMSLFIGSLAFQCTGGACYDITDDRLGILIGSFISGIAGYILLKHQLKETPAPSPE